MCAIISENGNMGYMTWKAWLTHEILYSGVNEYHKDIFGFNHPLMRMHRFNKGATLQLLHVEVTHYNQNM